MVKKALIPFRARVEIFTPFSFKKKPNTLEVSAKLCQTLALVRKKLARHFYYQRLLLLKHLYNVFNSRF